jgi:hypothetical protein
MKKWTYLWEPDSAASLARFASWARAELERRLSGVDAQEITLHVTEARPPRLTVIPFRRSPAALISVSGSDDELGKRVAERLAPLGGELDGYLVEEAQPLPRPRTWAAGEPAPGVTLLTVFRRHPRLSHERFVAEWHGRHTPMSLDIHPLISYVRNTVVEPLESTRARSRGWHGIVTEAYPTMRDLANPLFLFGGPLRAPFNMVRVGRHIASFMDLRTMRNYLVTERALEVGP